MDLVYDNGSVDDYYRDDVISTPRSLGKRKHPSQQQQQQQQERDEYDDNDIFLTPSISRDANNDGERDDVCSTPRKKQKTANGVAVRASTSSMLSPPPLLPKSTHRQRPNEVAELTEDDLSFLAFPSLSSSSLSSNPLSEEGEYPFRLSPRNALPSRRFCFGIPELAPQLRRNGLFQSIGEGDRDCDNYSVCSDDGSSSSASFSSADPPFLAMDDDYCEEDRRHKIMLPSLRARAKPGYSLSVDLSLPSFSCEPSSPATPVAA